MLTLRTGVRLGGRRTVLGVACFAALFCALGSCIMQELAHSQRISVVAQAAFAERSPGALDPAAVGAYERETDALGARARGLQTLNGALVWAQAWLVTLLGIAAVLVAVALTTAADLEHRRLLPSWRPGRASDRAFVIASVAGASAALRVAGGAAFGSLAAAVVGGRVWSLTSEPAQAHVTGVGDVRLPGCLTASWALAWIAVVGVVVLVSWFAGRALVALTVGGGLFGAIILLSDLLPDWFPGALLPATAGMWFHHRGEVTHQWLWSLTPIDHGGPSLEWSTLAARDPAGAATVGGLLMSAAVALACHWAVRRPLS